jgi:hypothetical protein
MSLSSSVSILPPWPKSRAENIQSSPGQRKNMPSVPSPSASILFAASMTPSQVVGNLSGVETGAAEQVGVICPMPIRLLPRCCDTRPEPLSVARFWRLDVSRSRNAPFSPAG